MTFITHGFRVSVVSDVQERVRDFRITFALYVKKIFISWVCKVCYTERVYKASNFILFVNMCSHVCQKILSTHFIPQRARWRSHNEKTKWQKEKKNKQKTIKKKRVNSFTTAYVVCAYNVPFLARSNRYNIMW